MGNIQVIAGPMFSGKTTELLRRLERYILAGRTWAYIKPDIDTRIQPIKIRNPRDGKEFLIDPIKSPVSGLMGLRVPASIIVIDEAQFFDEQIIEYAQVMRNWGRTVLIGGLDMDANRKPFGYMGQLMAIGDSVTKLTAVCKCGKDAAFTKKIVPGDNLIDIGDSEKYIACCGDCYVAEKEKMVC